MLKMNQMQEIQDFKLRGYSISEIVQFYETQGGKPPSLPTIRKYYNMDVIPKDPGINLVKDKAYDQEPFRSSIIEIARNLGNKDYCVSSIHDVLMEKFIGSGEFVKLPGNEQTLRNYIHYLKENNIIADEPENKRIYDHVFDTPPGEQMLIDFGQEHVAQGLDIHFICLLLRYSRLLCVFAQDHKYNSEEACRAIYRCICKLGGRPKQLVIDQDSVFIASETYGEVIETRTFGNFCSEQDIRLWVCKKADPESKGPIENSVGFVKKNFFSARDITSIDSVWSSLPGWLERKNKRIHKATFRIPIDVFNEIEKPALRPILPSVYETSPSSYIPYEVHGMPYVQYESCRYSIPREYCFKNVKYKVVSNKIYIYDESLNYICTHSISECRGSVIQLEEHKKEPSTDWISIAESMRRKWNCYSFQHFINGVKKENPRYLSQQLAAIERFLDSEKPERDLVSQVLDECCKNYRYKFSQFRIVYQLAKAGRMEPSTYESSDVQKQDMEVYKKAFLDRCAN